MRPRAAHVQQHESSDCAAACLATVSRVHGRAVTISSLRDAMGTGIRGTTMRGLVSAAEKLGFDARPARVDEDGLRSPFTLPAIAQTFNAAGDSHFVVIHRRRRDQLLLSDPGRPKPAWVPVEEFLGRFTGVLLLLAPSSSFERRRQSNRGTFTKFVSLLRPQRALFVWAVVSSLVLTLLGIAGSLVPKLFFDEVVPYGLDDLLLPVILLFLGLLVLQNLVQFLRQWIVAHLSQRIDLPLILGYFRHVYGLPMTFFGSRSVGDVLTRFGDAMTIKNVLVGAALTVVMDLVMAVLTGIALVAMDSTLFIVTAAFVVISVVLVLSFRIPYRRVNQRQMEQASVLNSRIIEGLRGVEGIKLDANEDREMEAIEREYVRSLRISFREEMLAAGQGTLSSLVQALANLGILGLGTHRILEGDLTLGSLISFVALSAFFVDPVSRLVGLQMGWQEATIALRRVGEILEQETEASLAPPPAGELDDATSAVAFDNVTFAYHLRDAALRDVTFSIPRGSRVAFVGPSGSGKSTIAKLIIKTYEPDSGTVAVRGVETGRWDALGLRRSVGYVPQVVQLFSRSVLDNVRLSVPDATESEVWKALRAAQAEGFVRALPHHVGTVLEEAGAGLSGGERRRLGLARALLKPVDLYVLDEVTSDLDGLTEAKVMDGLFDRLGDATVILVSHRLAAVTGCDRIYVMDRGRVVEEGSHEELYAAGGMYTALWDAQHATHLPRPEGRRRSRRPPGERAPAATDPFEVRYDDAVSLAAAEPRGGGPFGAGDRG